MRKVPTIILSITYKGVKFIDAANKASRSHSPYEAANINSQLASTVCEITSHIIYLSCQMLFMFVFPNQEQIHLY